MSKHVLGLDLGVGSIGWCLIALDAQGDPAEILGMGSRVVPLTNLGDDKAFSKGEAFTANQKRTARRTMRRGFARYQLRRYRLRATRRQNAPARTTTALPTVTLRSITTAE